VCLTGALKQSVQVGAERLFDRGARTLGHTHSFGVVKFDKTTMFAEIRTDEKFTVHWSHDIDSPMLEQSLTLQAEDGIPLDKATGVELAFSEADGWVAALVDETE
jgi:hypothetical protein